MTGNFPMAKPYVTIFTFCIFYRLFFSKDSIRFHRHTIKYIYIYACYINYGFADRQTSGPVDLGYFAPGASDQHNYYHDYSYTVDEPKGLRCRKYL